jgi:predicted ester cyclase
MGTNGTREQMDGKLVAANAELGRRFFAEQDRLRGGPAEALCGPGYTARLGSMPSMDRAGHEGFARGFYAGFPDVAHHIEAVIATADTAVVRFVLRGTHSGSFFGIPASGRSIEIPAHVILRVSEGRVQELLGVFDEAGLLRQIGVLPGG